MRFVFTEASDLSAPRGAPAGLDTNANGLSIANTVMTTRHIKGGFGDCAIVERAGDNRPVGAGRRR